MAYTTNWDSIIEFQTGQEVSDKFDVAFSNIDVGINANLDAIVNVENKSVSNEQDVVVLYAEDRYTDKKGIDVDTLNTQGLFLCDTNLPTEFAGGEAIVKVTVSNVGDTITQQATDYAGDKDNLMFRTSTDAGVTWSVWTDKSGAAAVSNAFDMEDKSGIDLNTIQSKGIFLVDGANKPDHTNSGTLTVMEDMGNSHLLQLYKSTGNFKAFRRWFDGAVWDAWVEIEESHVIGLMMNMIIGKANKTSLPTIFSGEVVPADTLGKDLDWYHHFEAGSSIVVDLYTGTSDEYYHPQGFFLRAVSFNDAIEVAPSNRLIFIDSPDNTALPAEDLKLIIDGNVIPLAIISNTAGSMVVGYEQTWDAVIENITITTTFKITAITGVQTDKEYDYQKHNGIWERTDFLNTDSVNELIREYSTIVIMDLVDNKKPTNAEALVAFKTLPNYDWSKNDTFYIKDVTLGDKMVFCTYVAGNATDEASAGYFFFKDMTLCI